MISGNITAIPVQTIFLCIDIHRDTYVMYLVRAKPEKELSDLRNEMDSKNIENLGPFGETLHRTWRMQE
jgi:hypothetical protein